MFQINVADPRVLYRLYRDRRNPGTYYVLPGMDELAMGALTVQETT